MTKLRMNISMTMEYHCGDILVYYSDLIFYVCVDIAFSKPIK